MCVCDVEQLKVSHHHFIASKTVLKKTILICVCEMNNYNLMSHYVCTNNVSKGYNMLYERQLTLKKNYDIYGDRMEGNVLSNDVFSTFYLRLYCVGVVTETN